MVYLVDNPPARRQFRHPRRERPSGGIALHTAENTIDLTGIDTGAEAVADFIRRRDTPGSYHILADADSVIHLIRFSDEAFHDATGSNPYSLSVSGATQAAKWNSMPANRREAMVRNMALGAHLEAVWLLANYGIVVPARWISVGDYRNREPGFVRHADLDPNRRSDPGTTFPDELFFDTFADLQAGGTTGGDFTMADIERVMGELATIKTMVGQTATTAKNNRQVIVDNVVAILGPKIEQSIKVGVQGAQTAANNRDVITNRVDALIDQAVADIVAAIEDPDNADNVVPQ